MKKISLAVVAALASSSAFSAIDQYSYEEEIIVLGTRTPVEVTDSLSAVTVLQRTDIERYQARDLFQLLERVPGVSFVRNGGRGSSTSLILRGNQSDHSLFLIDGVRIGSATSGGATLSALSTGLIERIEIIRGPKSSLYGADAIGGVVNIITRKTSEPKELSIETSYGSNNTSETTVVGGINNDNYSFTTVVNILNTDGEDNTESKEGTYGDDDAHRNNSLGLNYQHQLNDALKINLSYNRNDSETEYDSSCRDALSGATIDCDMYSTGLVDVLSGLFEAQINEHWFSSFQLGLTNDESEQFADNLDINTTTNGGEFNTTKTEATWFNNIYLNDVHLLTAGLDYQLDEVDGSTQYDESSRDNKAAFLQLQSDFGAIDTNFGVRSDDNEQFGEKTTLSALAGVDIGDHYRAVASYGEGFKAPTFNDLYYPNYGNPSFVPEESKNYEVGLKANYDSLFFSAAAFKNEISNLIQYNPAIFSSDQIAEAEINGLEFGVNTQLAGWALGLTGTMIDPENKANGKLLRRRAERSFNFDADYGFGNATVGFSARYESERYDDVDNEVELDGYTLFSLRAAYQINDQWLLKAKVDNLTDEEYSTAFSSKSGAYLGQGREVFFSLMYTPSL